MLSLDRLRRAAKTLARDCAAQDPAALQRLKMRPPRPKGMALKHADYLHVIAQENGFESWPRLKLAADTHGLDRVARQQRLKIALYSGQGWVADHLLAETPDLADGMFGLNCALYDVAAVREALSTDPSLATKSIGPRRPILHLAFSRWIKHRPDLETQMLEVAELLLAHGADVDDGYPVEPGSDYMLPALYGAIGHANNMALGRWLLEHGADPNDGESLYHATELGHHEGLKMLLAHGADPKGTNALLRAMDFDDVEAVRMLLDHGARADDFDGTHVGGEAPWVVPALHQAARRWSRAEMVQLLLDKGADPKRVFEGAGTYGYARVFGNQAVAQAIEARGAATVLSWEEELLAMAADGEDTGGAQLDAAKLPVAYRNIIRMILHLPGRLSHVKRLVKLGLPFDAPDTEGLTPVHLAGWEGLPEVIAYFLSLGPDLFHVNSYGGGLISTIIHGSENCPQREDRDYVTCARLALDAGAPLQASVVRFTGNEDLAAFFDDWMAAHPDRIARE